MPERLAVERARLVDVVDGETAEGLCVGEHRLLLSPRAGTRPARGARRLTRLC